MPSREHEILLGLFKNRPDLAGQLLSRTQHVRIPAYRSARMESGDLTDWAPAEYRADAVVTLTGHAQEPVLAVVVEIQRRWDQHKPWSWPVYVSAVRARMKCPAELLVLCPNPRTAVRCARPIRLGLGSGDSESVLRPLVVGPAAVPVITDTETAIEAPELTVISALIHGGGEHAEPVLKATMDALGSLGPDLGRTCGDFLHSELPISARQYLEALVKTATDHADGPFSRLARRWEAKGEAKGRAEGEVAMLLDVLAARRLDLTTEQHATITACTDEQQLRTWLRRALHATSADQLFT